MFPRALLPQQAANLTAGGFPWDVVMAGEPLNSQFNTLSKLLSFQQAANLTAGGSPGTL